MSDKIRLHVNLTDEADRILKVYKKDRGLNRTQAVHRALALMSLFDTVWANKARVLVEYEDKTTTELRII